MIPCLSRLTPSLLPALGFLATTLTIICNRFHRLRIFVYSSPHEENDDDSE